MPSPEDAGPPPFQIAFSGVIAESIRQLQRRASLQGRGEEFLRSLREVIDRIQQDPNEVGEPLYRLAVLRMQVRCVAIRPLYLDFAVCEDRPLVFIRAVNLFSPREE